MYAQRGDRCIIASTLRYHRARPATLRRRPLYLRTAGMGVYWLHVRLDARPKYDHLKPYRTG